MYLTIATTDAQGHPVTLSMILINEMISKLLDALDLIVLKIGAIHQRRA